MASQRGLLRRRVTTAAIVCHTLPPGALGASGTSDASGTLSACGTSDASGTSDACGTFRTSAHPFDATAGRRAAAALIAAPAAARRSDRGGCSGAGGSAGVEGVGVALLEGRELGQGGVTLRRHGRELAARQRAQGREGYRERERKLRWMGGESNKREEPDNTPTYASHCILLFCCIAVCQSNTVAAKAEA